MLATSKIVLFPCHNHLLITSTDSSGAQAIIKVPGQQWLTGSYNLEILHLEVASMVVTWWIVIFCAVVPI